jgi:sigma-E factor negative regulatory protein RseA
MSQSKFSVNYPASADPLPENCLPLSTREHLSALADDELGDAQVAALLAACRQDDAALDCWNTYQLIGEALRSPAQAVNGAAPDADLAFVSRLGQRLAQEAIGKPLSLAPAAPVAPVQTRPEPPVNLAHHRGQPANDSSFRWKLAAGVASLAALSAIAWNASGLLAPLANPQLAQAGAAPAQILVASPQGAMLRDARLEELLAAHKQFGATSALQEPSGFLRNATFEMPQAPVAGR